MFLYAYPQTITWMKRVRVEGETTKQGNDVFVEVSTQMEGCFFWPRATEERTTSEVLEVVRDRSTVTSAVSGRVPETFLIGSNDKLVFSGIDGIMDGTYEVEGRPLHHSNPYTGDKVKIVNATRVTG